MDGSIPVVSQQTTDAADEKHILLSRQVAYTISGVHEQIDMVDDPELLELVEMEIKNVKHV
jgi:translation elongation factor EF-Tu-like GTPase